MEKMGWEESRDEQRWKLVCLHKSIITGGSQVAAVPASTFNRSDGK